MKRREFVKGAGMLSAGLAVREVWGGETNTADMKIATFVCDATPPIGDTLLCCEKVEKVLEPLLLKGIVLESGGVRYVVAALDWCLVCNGSWDWFCKILADASGTESNNVTIHTVHQHTAPGVDDSVLQIARDLNVLKFPHLSQVFRNDLKLRLGRAVSEACLQLHTFNRIGTGFAMVDRVASDRRMMGPDGKIMVRYSTVAKKPLLAALAEGNIDPFLKVISFAQDDKVLARLHYYATHPQTHSCDGSADGDIVGRARRMLEEEEGVFQLYFTGCAGDQTVGKYNDGSKEAAEGLCQRLLAGMRGAIKDTKFENAGKIIWRSEKVVLPVKKGDALIDEMKKKVTSAQTGRDIYRAMRYLATVYRAEQPFLFTSLQIGDVHILHLPGEPMLAFQRYAQTTAQGKFVAVAGYGDDGTSYICTDQALVEGGYEAGASKLNPGGEAVMKAAIRKLLGK